MIASPLKIEPDVALIRMRISYHNFRVGCVCHPMPRQLPVDGSGNATTSFNTQDSRTLIIPNLGSGKLPYAVIFDVPEFTSDISEPPLWISPIIQEFANNCGALVVAPEWSLRLSLLDPSTLLYDIFDTRIGKKVTSPDTVLSITDGRPWSFTVSAEDQLHAALMMAFGLSPTDATTRYRSIRSGDRQAGC